MAEPSHHDFKGLLFDMDGTLIDSLLAVESAWAAFAVTYPHLRIQEILETSHGVRTEENLRRFIPDLSEDQIIAEAKRFEEEIVSAGQRNAKLGKKAFVPCVGVAENIIPALDTNNNWAICTSATRAYASQALPLAGVPIPEAFITADDVPAGKPDPAPYLKGADAIGIDPADCLVFEDTPAGVISGKAAGCTVLAVLGTHSRESVEQSKPDFILDDFSQIRIARISTGWRVGIPVAHQRDLDI